jgi:hypothetical protein
MPVYAPITKNGSSFTLDTGWSGAGFEAEVDELYRGLIATFAPNIPLDPAGVTCTSTQKCVVATYGNVGYVFVPSLGFAWWVQNINAQPNLPSWLDVY